MSPILNQVWDEVTSAWRYRWLALALAILIALFGWLVVFSLPDRYEAVASVFVDTRTSLKPVLNTPLLSRAPEDQIAELLSWYWQILAEMWREAFADPNVYVVQKTPGLFSLHSIAPDVFELSRQAGDLSKKGIGQVLKAIDVDSDFWHKANGTAGQFGSMKGFSILAEELRSYLPDIDLSME